MSRSKTLRRRLTGMDAPTAAMTVLALAAFALSTVEVLWGVAVLADGISSESPGLSDNGASVVAAFMTGSVGVLSAAVGAALSGKGHLPDGVGRVMVILAWGYSLFFILVTAGILAGAYRSPDGISESSAQILLVLITSVVSLLGFASGSKAAQDYAKASDQQLFDAGEQANEALLTSIDDPCTDCEKDPAADPAALETGTITGSDTGFTYTVENADGGAGEDYIKAKVDYSPVPDRKKKGK